MVLKFSGSFEDLQQKLVSLGRDWDTNQPNKKVFKYNQGVMNWFESTGTISFQGKNPGKLELENKVPYLLYPQEFTLKEQEKVDDPNSLENIDSNTMSSKSADTSLERKYLTTGINEGELVIGIVSAVGTDDSKVIETLSNRLERFGYNVKKIKVSESLSKKITKNEFERIKYYMQEGDRLRLESNNNGILMTSVASKIKELRELDECENKKNVYIISSLKHPDEVGLLRKIYSDGFYLIGIHTDERRRHQYLTVEKGISQENAKELIKIDEDESVPHGQKTRDTYHLSDFFLNVGNRDDQMKNHLQRFLELIFSNPYLNPTFDEFAMFMAFNSSVRSGDLSRQVGAVISKNKQIIATGANDVPQSGGGLYWAEVDEDSGEIKDSPDGKDYTREVDSNKKTQREIITDIVDNLRKNDFSEEDLEKIEKVLQKSKISDLTEFGRVVHAEMEALLSCSRVGMPTIGTTLYCTTFPCHNCTKHIIASGVKRVVYVEPYPKSKALDFHSESIEPKSENTNKRTNDDLNHRMIFEDFTGVGPRRFLDLFSMNLGRGSKLRRKDKTTGKTVDWDKKTAPIRTPLISKSYLEIENEAINMWNEIESKSN